LIDCGPIVIHKASVEGRFIVIVHCHRPGSQIRWSPESRSCRGKQTETDEFWV